MFNLQNKIVIITGASGGLGLEMAKSLAAQKAKIAIFDIKEKEGKNAVKNLSTKSKFYKVDINNEEEIKNSVKQVKEDFGSVDILINNAGVFYPTIISSTSKKEWDNLLSINLTGYFLMTKHVIPLMKNGSKIINISSVAGHHAFAGSAAYNSSKGAVIQLTKSMAMEYASKNINVNAVCPGIFVTPMTKDLVKAKEMKETIKNNVLLKRAGKAEEIGPLIVYLSSDECSYMTGSIITIDGGWTYHL